MEKVERYLKLDVPKPYSTFLWGARKTGKSTFLKEKFPSSIYVDLLKTDVLEKYIDKPYFLREEIVKTSKDKLQHPIIIDEVQKIPLLLDEVHWMIENVEEARFILCGSSSRKLKQSGSNLLGGRAWRSMFMPLCYPELKELDWDKIMNRGLLPSNYLSSHANNLISAYIYDYMLPEVHLEANLRTAQGFTRFLDALSFCHGELLNYNNIARDSAISAYAVRTYFEILVDMYLGYFVFPFRKQANRAIIKEAPKFYLMDTGLANYLKKYKFTEFRESEAGKAFEHYVFLEIMAYKLLNDLRYNINYWRTQDGRYEVDFVLNEGKIAIECKITKPIEKRHIKGLLVFGKEYGATLHVVGLESTKRLMTIDSQKVHVWPVEDFLKALWAGEIVS